MKNLYHKNNNILIYGCGNVGSRHLQGALKSKYNINIFIYDKKEISIKLAKQRISEVNFNKNKISIKFLKDFKFHNNFNLVILSTPAYKIFFILKKMIFELNFKNLIIEKIAFQSNQEFNKSIKLLKQNNINAWVNCANRTFNSYKKLKKIINKDDLITMIVSGGKMNFASNLIHYLDLFSYFIYDSKFRILLQNFNKPFKSKRKNYYEFDGYIIALSSKGDHLLVNSDINSSRPVTVDISTRNFNISIIEPLSKAYYMSEKNKWKIKEMNFIIENQSDLTKFLTESILKKNECDLIDVNSSFEINRMMLDIFLPHLNQSLNKNLNYCQIT